jgi:hypothetical protein
VRGCEPGRGGTVAGCYGQRRADGVPGECICGSGEFRRGEVVALGGDAAGLLDGERVTLRDRFGSLVSTLVAADGAFRLPFAVAAGERFGVFVASVTRGGRYADRGSCAVLGGEGRVPPLRQLRRVRGGGALAQRGGGGGRWELMSLRLRCHGALALAKKRQQQQQQQQKRLAAVGGAAAMNGEQWEPAAALPPRLPSRAAGTPPSPAHTLACQDLPTLLHPSESMSPAEEQTLIGETQLPCRRPFRLNPSFPISGARGGFVGRPGLQLVKRTRRDFVTELRSAHARCVAFDVGVRAAGEAGEAAGAEARAVRLVAPAGSAPKARGRVTVCAVPALLWLDRGRASLLRDRRRWCRWQCEAVGVGTARVCAGAAALQGNRSMLLVAVGEDHDTRIVVRVRDAPAGHCGRAGHSGGGGGGSGSGGAAPALAVVAVAGVVGLGLWQDRRARAVARRARRIPAVDARRSALLPPLQL